MNSGSDSFEQTQFLPNMIGRYRVKSTLGRGGFGSVFLAYDEELEREVAIKVPNANLLGGQITVKEYLDEARMVAKLDHPNIVPVYDVGTCDEFGCFVVSKYIEGADLRKILKQHRFDYLESTRLVAKIGDALHHAHRNGLVHRDIKPSNILLDGDSNPYVADFGLALPEQNVGKGPKFAGTPAYMSPEQARGEGHRVDGRSDVFSLGAILFELLSGKRPFRGDTRSELREQIELLEPRPLRQYDEALPKELDRICQKALAKRAKERYWTAHDMAEDLNAFLSQNKTLSDSQSRGSFQGILPSTRSELSGLLETRADDPGPTPKSELPNLGAHSESQHAIVLPKGLRSFDKDDADFFLELLPGPRDRDGLPDILRFWKKRIEATDVDDSFRVGLIYGPSGCGKSSFVKAGLLPRLASRVIPVFIESTTEFTETRLLNAIHKFCPSLDKTVGLSEAIAMIRRGQGTPPNTKVLLIFDQFEQWLHATRGESTKGMVDALRQCDGVRIQAILMVRSDFWMAVTRFLDELEVELVQGKNFAAMDLFPPRHAKKVLIAFGRAFGTLPAEGSLEPEQIEFVNQSIDGLAQGGKLICVRLALYAEMMKNKPWSSATLKQIGGTEGVGSAFLEDSFGPQANPKIRLHQVAARLVLRSLLPESETMINIKIQSYDDLYRASGYSDSKQFNELVRILDAEMRLISPTDPSGIQEESNEATTADFDPDKKYFRLTHDYLVTALRKWLNRKQRETRKGRAELLLAERASFWHAKHETRYLPSLLEHFFIRTFTSRGSWTKVENEVMTSAAKTHGNWAAVTLVVAGLLATGGFALRNSVLANRQRAESVRLVDGLLKSDTRRVSEFVAELNDYRQWADDDLQKAFDESEIGSQEKLHAAMALASSSPKCLDYLREQLPHVSAIRFRPVVDSLMNADPKLPASYAPLVADQTAAHHLRLTAACAIAQFDSTHEIWKSETHCNDIVELLTRLYPSQLAPLRDALRPVADSLLPQLNAIFRDQNREPQQRSFATETLVDYKKDSPADLFDLLIDCDERQYPLVLDALHGEEKLVIELAREELNIPLANEMREPDKSVWTTRKSNSAVALYQLRQFDDVWSIFKISDDPQLSSNVIHWLANRNSDPAEILKKFLSSSDTELQRSLVLSLGEFDRNSFSESESAALKNKLLLILRSNHAALKSAAQWLLTSIDPAAIQPVVDEQLEDDRKSRIAWTAKLEAAREKFASSQDVKQWETESAEISHSQAIELAELQRDWFYTSNAQVMIRLNASSYLMGESDEIAFPGDYSNQHLRHLDRTFALANTEVTVRQWTEFLKDTSVNDAMRVKFANNYQPGDNRPIVNTTWFEAVHYCNWLSQQDGIPENQWCYVPRAGIGFVPGMKVRPEFWKLHGYRLPTQAEWEYACRSGTTTQRDYGSSDELLGEYAWYLGNSQEKTGDVGTRKPSPWGLFDMHGNAMEWCFDLHHTFKKFEEVEFDFPDTDSNIGNQERTLRGGAYYDRPKHVRSAHRYSYDPQSQLDATGFRIARTLRIEKSE